MIIICRRVKGPLLFSDNLTANCDECGHLVEFRPNMPKASAQRCVECALETILPEDEVSILPQTMEDLRIFLRRQKQ